MGGQSFMKQRYILIPFMLVMILDAKMLQGKPAYSDGNQLLRRLEVPHLIWPVGEQRYVAKAMIIFLRAAKLVTGPLQNEKISCKPTNL